MSQKQDNLLVVSQLTRVRWFKLTVLYIAPRADVPRTLAINDDVANAAASSESERDPDKEEKFENENQVGDEGCPVVWRQISPNFILAGMKLLNATNRGANKKDFYKSSQYSNWTKMNADQRNKAVTWFNLLTDGVKGAMHEISFHLPTF